MQFIAPAPWSTITKLLRASRKRQAVSAYLGTGASTLLPLEKGDRLVVNASDANVRAGAVNPHELETFRKRGVKLYHVANLHAKIYIADHTVISGSANASSHSSDNLIESCVQVTDKNLALEVTKWIDGLSLIPLLTQTVDRLKLIYKPPTWERQEITKKRPAAQVARAWVTYVGSIDESGQLDDYAESVAERHDLDGGDVFSFSSAQYKKPTLAATHAEPGDEFFVIDHLNNRTVYGPMRLIEKPIVEMVGQLHVASFATEDTQDSLTFRKFCAAVKRAGLSIPASGLCTKRLKSDAAAFARKG